MPHCPSPSYWGQRRSRKTSFHRYSWRKLSPPTFWSRQLSHDAFPNHIFQHPPPMSDGHICSGTNLPPELDALLRAPSSHTTRSFFPHIIFSMDNKSLPLSQGARLPVAGPLPARNQPTGGISSPLAGGVRRKRGPAGRETTHPLTVNFPQRPESKEQQSNPIIG